MMNTNQSGAPIKFCGTQDELINGGCLAEHMVGPLSEIFSAEVNVRIIMLLRIPSAVILH